MCRGMTCVMQARLGWVRAKWEKGESVINKEDGKHESDTPFQWVIHLCRECKEPMEVCVCGCGCVGVWVHGCVYMDPPLTELSWTLSVQSEPWGGCSDFSCPHYAAPSHFWLGGYKLCRRQIQSCVCINMHANAWFQGAVIPFDSLSWVWWGLIDDWKNIKACSVGVEAPCCDCWCVVLWNCLLYQSLHPAAS